METVDNARSEVDARKQDELARARKRGKTGRVVYRLIEGDVKRGEEVVGRGVKDSAGKVYLTGSGTWKRAVPKVRMSKKERKAARRASILDPTVGPGTIAAAGGEPRAEGMGGEGTGE